MAIHFAQPPRVLVFLRLPEFCVLQKTLESKAPEVIAPLIVPQFWNLFSRQEKNMAPVLGAPVADDWSGPDYGDGLVVDG